MLTKKPLSIYGSLKHSRYGNAKPRLRTSELEYKKSKVFIRYIIYILSLAYQSRKYLTREGSVPTVRVKLLDGN